MTKMYRHGGEHKGGEPVQSSMLTNIVRNMIPIPLPAAQAAASKITGDTSFGFADASQAVQDEVALSVINARKRTGQNRGGTEYIDYSEEIDRDINSLSPKFLDAAIASVKSPDFRAATTFGRVSYSYDPKTDTYSVYDSYDFSPIKGDPSTTYGKTRKALGDGEKGSAKLIGTFKGGDYEDKKTSNDYSHVKRFMSELGSYLKDTPPTTTRMTFKKGGKVKYRSRVNEAGNYTKPGLRKRIFNRVKAGSKGGKPGQWSARKAQLLAKLYKAAGGGYK
jgi:hypothetical protein